LVVDVDANSIFLANWLEGTDRLEIGQEIVQGGGKKRERFEKGP
jgi:hypothetical protein